MNEQTDLPWTGVSWPEAPCQGHKGVREGGKASGGDRVHGNRGWGPAAVLGAGQGRRVSWWSLWGHQGHQKVSAQPGIRLRH